MDDLPPPLLLEILTRLSDSSDLSRCRVASKTLNSIAPEIRSVKLQCSYLRYAKSRSPHTKSSITPFKSVFNKLISDLPLVESVSIGIEKPLRLAAYADVEDEEDDLFLCDVNFVKSWLPKVAWGLRKISISDFWVQSCWRRSDVLALISSYCRSLIELEIKNAWLSVDGLNPMPNLTSLTLEFIRLDDENLDKVTICFPSLQSLSLIGVGGLKEPKIHLMHLKIIYWTISNAPTSITIIAPNLAKINLKCVKPNLLFIDAPLVSEMHLSLENAGNFEVKGFANLRKLHLESTRLRYLLHTFPFGITVKSLTVASTRWDTPIGDSKSILELLLCVFPNIRSLTLTSGSWSEFEANLGFGDLESNAQMMKGLKEITAYLTVIDIEATISSIFSILDNFSNLSYMVMLVHRDVVSNVTNRLISRCMARCSKVTWKWGMWKEGTKDSWISDGI